MSSSSGRASAASSAERIRRRGGSAPRRWGRRAEGADARGGPLKLDTTAPGSAGFEHWVACGQGWGGGAWYRAAREVDADVRFYEVPEPCLYYRGTGMKFQIAPRCASASALIRYYERLFPQPLP